MRNRHLRFTATCVAISCALCACGKPPLSPLPPAGTPVVGVIKVQKRAVPLSTELPGRTVPFLIADVRPQVNGIITSRNFREGSDVKAGQTLYQIDPAPYQAVYNSSVAALAKAQASLKTARLKSDRYKELVTINAVSRQEYDDASASLDEIVADVAAAKANVETSRINLDYARVEAPISGRVGRSNVTPGALAIASQATAMATIQQLDPIYVDVTQPSIALLNLKEALEKGEIQKAATNAAKVSLVLENGRVYPLEGQLEFSDVTVNQDTGAITLRAVFPNPRADLLPGMYVRAVLQSGVNEKGLLVPQQAVSRDSTGKPTVYIVGADNKLERRVIETDRAIGDQWLVLNGLQEGDELVVDGQQRAAPGVEVKVTPWPSPQAAQSPAMDISTVNVAKHAVNNQ